MAARLFERISIQIHRLTFAALILIGAAVVCLLVYSIGDPTAQITELVRDPYNLRYVANTFTLFLLSIAIQIVFFVWGTMYIRRPSGVAKIALILPFATGNIAPAAGLHALFDTQIGPFSSTPWFLTGPAGARLVVALLDAWQWMGVLLFLGFAYTERISHSHFQQARLEGMNRLQQWKWIVWPAVWRVVGIYVGIKALDWVRKFEIIRILYGNGGPDEAVKTFAMHAAITWFDAGKDRYALALALSQVIVLALCVLLALRTVTPPKDLGRAENSILRVGDAPLGGVLFWSVLSIVLVAPVLWLTSMSLQSNDVILHGHYKLWPALALATSENFRRFLPGGDSELLRDLMWSVGFFGIATVCAILIAANAVYRLKVHSSLEVERRNFTAVIGIFFMPAFAVYSTVELLHQWTSIRLDLYALFIFSVLSGYALGFFTIYSAFHHGFRLRYEQLLLEFGSPFLAFWKGIIWPQNWILCVSAVLVFATSWNELFLSDKWTSGGHWRSFAVVIGTGIQQYRTEYSTLAAGAVISMLTPLILGVALYLILLAAGLPRIILHARAARPPRNPRLHNRKETIGHE